VGVSEDEAERLQVLAADPSVSDRDVEVPTGGARFAELEGLVVEQFDPDGAVGEFASVGGLDVFERLGGGFFPELVHSSGADEEGEVAGGGALREVAAACLGEGDLDRVVFAERVGPLVSEL
jgi:hypothetical protein